MGTPTKRVQKLREARKLAQKKRNPSRCFGVLDEQSMWRQIASELKRKRSKSRKNEENSSRNAVTANLVDSQRKLRPRKRTKSTIELQRVKAVGAVDYELLENNSVSHQDYDYIPKMSKVGSGRSLRRYKRKLVSR